MPSGGPPGGASYKARQGDLHPAPVPAPGNTDREPTKRDLASWWKNFKRGNQRREDERAIEPEPQGIFGVPLQQSVKYANVAISLFDSEGKSYIYGYVPIVVAKCGVFLKEKATDVEGIFRLSGSEKRIKELRQAFNSPDRYGKGLDWTGYTVHDAANILRRYFNQLPEPIIPLDFYERFREPIRHHQGEAVGNMDGQSPSVGTFNVAEAIVTYQRLITELPPLNRQLLLYILDLLAVFASKADMNKMTTPNLAAIFQPGILSHPTHSMAPSEYRLSQDVLIFLIENQDHFLIGMQGTAADEQTVKDVESGPPTPQARTPGSKHSKTLGRSGSAASKFSTGIRRSVSVSSKHSHASGAVPLTPSAPSPISMSPVSSGVHRSNTVPSKQRAGGTAGMGTRRRDRASDSPSRDNSPSIASTPAASTPPISTPGVGFIPGAFPVGTTPAISPSQEKAGPALVEDQPPVSGGLDPMVLATEHMPNVLTKRNPNATSVVTTTPWATERPDHAPLEVISPTSSRTTTPSMMPSTLHAGDMDSKTHLVGQATKPRSLDGPETPTASKSGFAAFLGNKGTPPSEGRKPNKLQKKQRGQGGNDLSAQSSANSLKDQVAMDPPHAVNILPEAQLPSTVISVPTRSQAPQTLQDIQRELSAPTDSAVGPSNIGLGMTATGADFRSPPAVQSNPSALKPGMSPSNSFVSRSTATNEETDRALAGIPPLVEETSRELVSDSAEGEREKRRRWFSGDRRDTSRGSRSNIALRNDSQEIFVPPPKIGTNEGASRSRSSLLGGSEGRRSMQIGRIGSRPQHESASFPPPAPTLSSLSAAESENMSSGANIPRGEGKEKDAKQGGNPLKWMKGKLAERAEKKEEKERQKELERARSPPPAGSSFASSSKHNLSEAGNAHRGRSFEVSRAVQPGPESATAAAVAAHDAGYDAGKVPAIPVGRPRAESNTSRRLGTRRTSRSSGREPRIPNHQPQDPTAAVTAALKAASRSSSGAGPAKVDTHVPTGPGSAAAATAAVEAARPSGVGPAPAPVPAPGIAVMDKAAETGNPKTATS